jgi:hypothetical protein
MGLNGKRVAKVNEKIRNTKSSMEYESYGNMEWGTRMNSPPHDLAKSSRLDSKLPVLQLELCFEVDCVLMMAPDESLNEAA